MRTKMPGGNLPRCKCKVCGKKFLSYTKADLCLQHYMDAREAEQKFLESLDPDKIGTGKKVIFDPNSNKSVRIG